MSLDYTKTPQYHYDLGKTLAKLRNKGVLIIGSGNIVHNLGLVAWDKLNQADFAYDWAKEVHERSNEMIKNGKHDELIAYSALGRSFQLSIPTPEHYLPLLYILAMQEEKDEISFFNNKAVGGSITMTSLKLS